MQLLDSSSSENSDGNTLKDNTAHDSSGNGSGTLDGFGLYILNSNLTTVQGMHLYGNEQDFKINGTGIIVNLTNAIFDNPLGNMANFTNLSLYDTVSSSYILDHATEPAPTPTGEFFNGKFVDMTDLTTGVSIDAITWHWLQSEVGSFDESLLALYKYNGTDWLLQNDNPDTGANTLSLNNLNSFSVFGILHNATTVAVPSNFSIDKTDVTLLPLSPGGLASFDIEIENLGTAPISPVVIDVLPAGLTFSSASINPNSVVGQTLTWNSISILPSSTTTITVNAMADSGIVNASTMFANLTNFVNVTENSTTHNDTANVSLTYANVSFPRLPTIRLPALSNSISQFSTPEMLRWTL